MDYNIGDIVRTKKQHPCGSKLWEITRVGVDFKLKCQGCGHVVMIPREKALKIITKKVENENKNENKYLISETTKEERKDIVKKALGISLLGADMPSDDVLDLAKQYIDGKIEIEEIQKQVLKKYTNGGNK